MRIGIDVRCLASQLTGIGYYTQNVIKALDQRGIETVLFSPAPLWVDFSSYQHCQIVVRSYRSLIGRQIWCELYLQFLLVRYDLDVFWGPSHRLPLFLPKKMARVVTIHDVIWKVMPETMRKKTRLLENLFMRRSIRRADRVIAVSESTRQDIKRFFGPSLKDIRKIPLAPRFQKIDVDSKKNEISLKRNKPYILFVGTLEPRKNFTGLIKGYFALSKFLRQTYDLVIVGGNGWGDQVHFQNLKNDSKSETVHFMDYVTDDTLMELYRGATCLVLPSFYEGFGLPILEAQSFGVPVITSNVSSMPEVVGDGGLLIDPNSVESIKNALECLLKDFKLRKSLSKKAKLNLKKFSWEKTIESTCDVFIESMNLRGVS